MTGAALRRFLIVLALTCCAARGQQEGWRLSADTDADREFAAYLEKRVAAIEARDTGLRTDSPEAWEKSRLERRRELKEMLGLDPEPERTPLEATVTKTSERDGFVVENLHFQPMPKLYVAANLYRPAKVSEPVPAILYLCGHANPSRNGVTPGNKAAYHHHAVWFARHGYVCLVLDTIQWGEFPGEHHGTYRLGRWWWASRGYSPAGVEAWASVRALDYLESRPEVDAAKIGATGRSGGGAYTWWIAAIDDRIRAAVPVAGITTLRDHVLRGCIEGHCDCMFMTNSYRWDFDTVASLVAPRPLLISNTDKDDIFPLSGVMRIFGKTRRVYRALGAAENIGVHIAEGPHKDSQPLNTGAFAWFERQFKGRDLMATFDEAAKPSIELTDLKVFDDLPKDERTTTIDESFVPRAPVPPVPASAEEWAALRDRWMAALAAGPFRDLPGVSESNDLPPAPGAPESGDGADGMPVVLRAYESGAGGRLLATAGLAPGFAVDSLTGNSRKRNHLRRRLLLLGTSAEAIQSESIVRAVAALRKEHPGSVVGIEARGDLAGCALYASLFADGVGRLTLTDLPESHDHGPTFPGIERILDLPGALALALERCDIVLHGARPDAWTFASETAAKLGWGHALTVVPDIDVTEVTRIWDGAPHNAFTTLLRRGDEWFCAFREGSGHIPGTNGTIRILTSLDTRTWESAALVAEEGIDLRDPKLSIGPDNLLVLTTGGSVYSGAGPTTHGKLESMQSRSFTSTDGRTWSDPNRVCRPNEWLWRVVWQGGTGYGFSYANGPGTTPFGDLTLWKTTDGRSFADAGRPPLHRRMHPSEAAIRFLDDGTMLALVRNEPGTLNAFFGRRAPDWNEWQWTDTGRPVQGPDFLPLPGGRLLFAGRDRVDGAARTVAGFLTNGQAVPVVALPSGGDCSYPGLVAADDGSVLMSYYSSHEGRAAIYLARLNVRH